MDPQHEAVELRLGQRKGALVLDRVLGGEHHERRRHLVADAVNRDLALLHRLEQRRLRLGRGPVDLVGQHDLREDRARGGTRSLGLAVVDETPVTSVGSRSGVNWIRLKMQPVERAMLRASIVLPTPGTSSIKHMALAQQRRQREASSAFLPTMTFSTLPMIPSAIARILHRLVPPPLAAAARLNQAGTRFLPRPASLTRSKKMLINRS